MNERCAICDRPDAAGDLACSACSEKYPSALLCVLCVGSCPTTIGLRNGWIVFFEDANVEGPWITLSGIDLKANENLGVPPLPLKFAGGLAVRFDDIIWAAQGFVGA
jgi:hypothetical protein